MDLDSIITFVFLLVFFILPSILKVLAKKKKATASTPEKKNPLSVLGKIGERVQKFVQELEEQARQQQRDQKGQKEQNVWETLSEKGTDQDDEWVYLKTDEEKIQTPPLPPVRDPEYSTKISFDDSQADIKEPLFPEEIPPVESDAGTIRHRFKAHPLQNAVVWSEILSKPVALRK